MKKRIAAWLAGMLIIPAGLIGYTTVAAHAALCDGVSTQVDWVTSDYQWPVTLDYKTSEIGFKHCWNTQTNRWVDEIQWTRTTWHDGNGFDCSGYNEYDYFVDNWNFIDDDGHTHNPPAHTIDCETDGHVILAYSYAGDKIRVHSDSAGNDRWTNRSYIQHIDTNVISFDSTHSHDFFS